MEDILDKLFLEETRGKPFDINLYIKDTPPLTDEEFARMMAHENNDISIDELDFEKSNFNILDYIVVKLKSEYALSER